MPATEIRVSSERRGGFRVECDLCGYDGRVYPAGSPNLRADLDRHLSLSHGEWGAVDHRAERPEAVPVATWDRLSWRARLALVKRLGQS